MCGGICEYVRPPRGGFYSVRGAYRAEIGYFRTPKTIYVVLTTEFKVGAPAKRGGRVFSDSRVSAEARGADFTILFPNSVVKTT